MVASSLPNFVGAGTTLPMRKPSKEALAEVGVDMSSIAGVTDHGGVVRKSLRDTLNLTAWCLRRVPQTLEPQNPMPKTLSI